MERAVLSVDSATAVAFAPVCAAIHRQAFAEPWTEETFISLLNDPTVRLWVAVAGQDQAPTAFLLCRTVLDEAEILTIGTAAAVLRQGWGRQVMDAAQAELKANGIAHWFLEVAEDNAPAQGLYEALGFAVVGQRKNYYEPHHPGGPRRHALVMGLELSQVGETVAD